MRSDSQQIVQKLWSYCNILRDDGLSYPDYVEQLTYLLFLKMAQEQAELNPGREQPMPEGFDWQSLVKKDGKSLHTHYAKILRRLSKGSGMLGVIFRKAENKITDPAKLKLLVVDLINKMNWSALDADVKGDAYEGLLEKNAQDTKSGAGQYFTPRPLIHAVVECVRPQPGEIICDPACGTGGFLLAAYEYVRRQFPRLTRAQERHLRLKAIRGFELVDAVTRLGAMNLFLHGIGPASGEEDLPIITLDSLNQPPDQLYDVVLTNPPFGKKSSVMMVNERGNRERKTMTVVREDFFVSTSNKQLSFLQHVMTMLKPNGRAAVVIPDNVLFEGGAGESLRRQLLREFNVHTLLRLPTGIFYAQGVKANVLFFDRAPRNNAPATDRLWVFDLRNSMRFSLRTRPWERSDLDEFVSCYNADDRHQRRATWSDRNHGGRWRPFSYEELSQRHKYNLDIVWLEDTDTDEVGSAADPSQIANEIMLELEAVMRQVSEIVTGLGQRER